MKKTACVTGVSFLLSVLILSGCASSASAQKSPGADSALAAVNAANGRGDLAFENKDYDLALEEYTKAIDLAKPDEYILGIIHLKMGGVYLAMDEAEDAVRCYGLALESDDPVAQVIAVQRLQSILDPKNSSRYNRLVQRQASEALGYSY